MTLKNANLLLMGASAITDIQLDSISLSMQTRKAPDTGSTPNEALEQYRFLARISVHDDIVAGGQFSVDGVLGGTDYSFKTIGGTFQGGNRIEVTAATYQDGSGQDINDGKWRLAVDRLQAVDQRGTRTGQHVQEWFSTGAWGQAIWSTSGFGATVDEIDVIRGGNLPVRATTITQTEVESVETQTEVRRTGTANTEYARVICRAVLSARFCNMTNNIVLADSVWRGNRIKGGFRSDNEIDFGLSSEYSPATFVVVRESIRGIQGKGSKMGEKTVEVVATTPWAASAWNPH